jgi:hypothetical protein
MTATPEVLEAPAGAAPATRVTVDFWFDPACPWAWLTSRWIHEVATVRPVDVRWHVMSLAVLNGKPDDTAEKVEQMQRLWRPVRVLVAARERYGAEVLGPLYTALGTRIHHGKEGLGVDTLRAALADAGLDPTLADSADDASLDDLVRASHDEGMEPVGNDVGTPVLHVEGEAFFGPVVSPLPRGEVAGRLWDGVRMVTGTPGFYELKRTRTGRPELD